MKKRATVQDLAEHSRQMLAQHQHTQRTELLRQMVEKFVRDNPNASGGEIAAHIRVTSKELGL